MKTNNIDTNIKEKFQNRTFEPSNSAWERLSTKLDEQPNQKKKGWIFYAGIAASILVLISIGFGLFSSEENQFQPKDEVVISPIDTSFIDSKLKEIKIENELEEAIVEVDGTKVKNENYSKKIKIPSTKNKVATKEQPLFVVNTTENNEKSSEIKFEKIDNTVAYSSSIKVNADDLLFSVTHNQKEVAAYYASNNIDREKLLKSIENELKKSDIKIDASSILAEVEGNINEDTFKNNFLQMIKKKVSDVASAVATRNN